MARAISEVADSEGKPENAEVEDDAMNGIEVDGEDAEEGGEEEEEEEYEIEEILDHQPGRFAQGRTGYLVKWKNYPPDQNSWVDEEDAGNAEELIATYWAKKKNKKAASASARKGRKSIATESPEPPAKKRRKSTAKDDEDEEKAVSVKRKKTATKKKAESMEPESEDNAVADSSKQDDLVHGESFMQRFMKQPSWEKLVSRVDTVEKSSSHDQLIVYFRLKKDGKRIRLPSKICKEKFPQALLNFYESNLKWKETEVDDMQSS
ncbi:hypothetical protein D9757_007509 [Collybiopsis confluens]|uniref:Chromo domain-containing protein n=1 Tax=Collybiopsis confluens TaxID=2823264 RepID=A0A8H5M8B0_9AGAR|nr:hypothetical protein D9757_007509 [Collybiopsis confluens]